MSTHEFPAASPDIAEKATRLIAEARVQCVQLGLDPQQFAELLLPEALLAMMIGGLQQEEVEAVFDRFRQTEIPAWFLQVKRTVGYCDCEREARGEHMASCAVGRLRMPVAQQIADEKSVEPASQARVS
ncbi:MAG: hypothetical protein AB7P12_17175 [Alphaproteobacteria bacterium]